MSISSEFDILFREKELLKIIERIEPCLKQVDSYGRVLRTGDIHNFEALNEALLRLGGYRSYLEPILGLAATYEEIHENDAYTTVMQAKMLRCEKVVDAVIKQEAQQAVKEETRLKNILQSYVNSCQAMISVLQSRLKSASNVD